MAEAATAPALLSWRPRCLCGSRRPIRGSSVASFMGLILSICLFFVIAPAAAQHRACTKPVYFQDDHPTRLDCYTDASMNMTDVFAVPVSTDPPPPQFRFKSTHRIPPKGISPETRHATGPIGTNNFYTNLFLDGQDLPAYTLPYSVAFVNGRHPSGSYGMAVTHTTADQFVFGEPSCTHGNDTAKYFYSPPVLQNVALSTAELGPGTVLTATEPTHASVMANLWPHPQAARPAVRYPLVQGMGFFTALYDGARPTVHNIKRILNAHEFAPIQFRRPGLDRFVLETLDGSLWVLYSQARRGTPNLKLRQRQGPELVLDAMAPFHGSIQVTRLPDQKQSLQKLDYAAGVYPTGVVVSGFVNNDTRLGSYTMTFVKADAYLGPQPLPRNEPVFVDGRPLIHRPLLMFALPHHVESFDSGTRKGLLSVGMQTPSKGVAKAVLADSWTMLEPDLPLDMDFMPWDPRTRRPVRAIRLAEARELILQFARKELDVDMDAATNLESIYFSGKALSKFAGILVSTAAILHDQELTASGLAKLKHAFSVFVANQCPGRKHPLAYDQVWGGVITTAADANNDSMADFGNAAYNDHHFHYGYYVHAAAVIAWLDPSWLTANGGANAAFVNTLVRDYANPSALDRYFPVSRTFDHYSGHSWAHGVFASMDGKNEESTSEDAMSLYGLKMWGHVLGTEAGRALAERSTLQMAILARSLQSYFYYYAYGPGATPDRPRHQPAGFVRNMVAGILFENKVDHGTFFGNFPQYIHGIHMLPLLPVTGLMRPAAFVAEEWNATFSHGRAFANLEDKNWVGVLYGNLAVADPEAAYAFFSQADFDPRFIDGGASRTWYLTYAAALAGK